MLFNSLRTLIQTVSLPFIKKITTSFTLQNHRYYIVSFYDVLADKLISSLASLPNKKNLITFLDYLSLNIPFKKLPLYFYFVASLFMLVIFFIMLPNFINCCSVNTQSYLLYFYSNLEESLVGFYDILLTYLDIKLVTSSFFDSFYNETLRFMAETAQIIVELDERAGLFAAFQQMIWEFYFDLRDFSDVLSYKDWVTEAAAACTPVNISFWGICKMWEISTYGIFVEPAPTPEDVALEIELDKLKAVIASLAIPDTVDFSGEN
jgi:hypothetical protein